MPAQIIYNAKSGDVPYYAIKLGTFSSNDHMSYANTNSSLSTVVGWSYASGSANGSAWAIEPVARVSLNAVGDKSYATFYFDRDVQTDANTKAYYITTTSSNYAQLTEVDNDGLDIPAYTAVVLINSEMASSTKFNVTSGLSSVVDAETNLLKGTLTSMQLDLSDATPYYSMGRLNGEIGFYKFNNNGTTTITLGANKAYLDTMASTNSKGFIFTFEDPDGIINVVENECDTETWYTLDGRRLPNKPTASGIYIVNGKKIMIR